MRSSNRCNGLMGDAPATVRTPLLGTEHESDVADPPRQSTGQQRDGDQHDIAFPEYSLSRRVLVMAAMWLCNFFAAMDMTIMATLSSPIASSLESSAAFAWIATAYVISNAAVQPLAGKLTDIYGRRLGLILASICFASGTLICGLARNQNTMILGRSVAGIGGGCLPILSTFVASDMTPLRDRALWQGIGNVIFGIGMSLGGVFGGLMHEKLHWSYAFLVQVPFIASSGLLAAYTVECKDEVGESYIQKLRRVDFLGAFTLIIALVLFLLGLNSRGHIVLWDSPVVYIALPLSGLFLVLFLFNEKHVAPEPMIPLEIFGQLTVLASCITAWFSNMGMFCLLYYIPIYSNVVLGNDSTATGFLFIAQSASAALGSLGTGLFMQKAGKYRTWGITMNVLLVGACVMIMQNFRQTVSTPLPFALFAVAGFSNSCTLTLTLVAVIAAVGPEQQAVVTSALYTFRFTGASIGVAIASVVFQSSLQKSLTSLFGQEPGAEDKIRRIINSVDDVREFPVGWAEGVVECYVLALRNVWIVNTVFGCLVSLASTFIQEQKLHRTLSR